MEGQKEGRPATIRPETNTQVGIRLREERLKRGWTKDDVAAALVQLAAQLHDKAVPQVDSNLVGKWERGDRIAGRYYAPRLCVVFDLAPTELGFAPHPRLQSDFETLRDMMITMRQVLDRGSALVTSAVSDGLAPAAPIGTLIAWSEAQDLDVLLSHTQAFGRQVHTDRPRHLLLLLQSQMATFRSMLGHPHPAGTTQQIKRLAAETAVIAGYLSYRLHNYGDAEFYFAEADALAASAGDGPLRAMGLIARSALYSSVPHGGYGGDPATALALLDAAESAAGRRANPLLLTWLHARRVEDYASCGQFLQSDRSMESAERQFHSVGSRDPGFFHNWTPARLIGYRGSAAILLGRSREAISIVEPPLRQIPATLASERSFLQIILAAAYAQQCRVDDACGLLTEALQLAVGAGLTERVRRIRGTRRKHLGAWDTSQAVRELDEQLTAV